MLIHLGRLFVIVHLLVRILTGLIDRKWLIVVVVEWIKLLLGMYALIGIGKSGEDSFLCHVSLLTIIMHIVGLHLLIV